MIRLALALLLLLTGPLQAQDAPAPIVETVLDQAEVVPGQSVTLRLNILVPTWMPKPPDLPSFEMPDLRVRRPANGSTAISRSIDGETWSGVSRRYLLTPMVPGQFVLPPQNIPLTYIGPDGTTPIATSAVSDPVLLTGILPAGAEGLDPFIAAEALELTQEISGPTTDLDPGASVIRKVTATLTGASPIVLPPLLPAVDIPGLRVYPDSPQVTEQDDNGALSGSRVETETFMALGGGSGQVPGVQLDWFNLKTGQIEQAEVPGFEISVTGPPVPMAGAGRMPDWRVVLLLALAFLALWLVLRRLIPRWRQAIATRRAAYLASEAHARRKLLRAISHRDYRRATQWLVEWRARLTSSEPAAISRLMAQIGASIYRKGGRGDATPHWRALAREIRATGHRHARSGPALPALNPHDAVAGD